MVLLIFGHVVITLFAFCTFQSNFSTHLVTSVKLFFLNPRNPALIQLLHRNCGLVKILA